MSSINARRRRPAAGYAALLLGGSSLSALLYGVAHRQGASRGLGRGRGPAGHHGRQGPVQANCSSCHGLDAQGTSQAPSLIGAGAAAVDFQMSTGRMPAKEVGAENDRKPVTFTQQQIYDIADYIASLGGGPAIPTAEQVIHGRRGHRRSARSCSAPTARSATASPGRAAR